MAENRKTQQDDAATQVNTGDTPDVRKATERHREAEENLAKAQEESRQANVERAESLATELATTSSQTRHAEREFIESTNPDAYAPDGPLVIEHRGAPEEA